MNVSVVGLGRMGSRIAERLAVCGLTVTGWDRNPEAVRLLAATGIAVANDARAAAAAGEIVITCVTEDTGVRTIFTGPDGFCSTDIRGKLFVEMSTLRPQTAHELAPCVEARGAAYIDSPVLGSVSAIPRGALQALVGGASADVERARVVLSHVARSVEHMGPVGSGYAMKLVANLGLGAYIQALAEALAMGEGQGLNREAMLDILAQATTANAWIVNRRPILAGEADDVTLDIRTLRKDMVSALATGSATGVSMPVTSGVLAALAAAVAAGWGAGDIGQMPKFVRDAIVQHYD